MTEYLESVVDATTGETTTRVMTAAEIAAMFPAPSRQTQEAARRAAYTEEADPLFFMAQRGEATMAEWQAKVAEIKTRYPYPTV